MPETGARPAESLAALWLDLSSRYPSDFTVTPGEVEAWHEFEAAKFQEKNQWSAAAFHLRILLALCPDDPATVARLNRVKEKLANPESTAK